MDRHSLLGVRTERFEIYTSLFLTAFLAATLLPGFSEAGVAALVALGHAPMPVVLIAAAGNTLGAVVNWCLGRFVLKYREHRWFPVSTSQLERAQARYARFGIWSLLFAWVPIIGDPITFIAGVLKVRFWLFLLLVAAGKTGRYIVIAMLAQSASGSF